MNREMHVQTAAEVRNISKLSNALKLVFLILTRMKNGSMTVSLPDGRIFLFDQGFPGPSARVDIKDMALANRLLLRGDIGFAEAYMDEQFSTPDLTATLEYCAMNFDSAGSLARGNNIRNAIVKFIDMLTRRNTKNGAKKNILAHYDLGNDFYEKWLDPSMTYSSAIFAETNDMLPAQIEKYDAIARRIEARPDAHILEIGSGWGGFAEHAAKTYGSRVTTVTISDAQHDYARRRIFEAGLAERVNVELRDYREIDGQYDGVASIEMFEAVGESYWPSYFDKIASVLSSGKRAALQIITIDEALFPSYRNRVDFIQKYIFPGGMLPSIPALNKQFERAGLIFEESHMFGQSYAETLKTWAKSFKEAWPDIEKMGFDGPFRNLWEYYLCYCEAGFRTGRTDVGQFVLRKA